jgi:uncharacterized protein YodC (DUF2158 family)
MQFSAGDLVTLKSGGVPMTVVSTRKDVVECIWLGDDGDLFREHIPMIVLMHVHVSADHEVRADDDIAVDAWDAH